MAVMDMDLTKSQVGQGTPGTCIGASKFGDDRFNTCGNHVLKLCHQ